MINNILIIDDNVEYCQNICAYIKKSTSNNCEYRLDGIGGIEAVRKKVYDLIVIDYQLENELGINVLKDIRKIYSGPIIFLTCVSDLETKLDVLSNGADDYLIKPVSLKELNLRIENLIARISGDRFLKIDDYLFDTHLKTVCYKNEPIEINCKAYSVLLTLLKNKNVAMDRETIFNSIWNSDYKFSSRVIDTAVFKIRKMTGDERIKNIWGVGYMYEDENIEN